MAIALSRTDEQESCDGERHKTYRPPGDRLKIQILFCVHIVVCCVSLFYIAAKKGRIDLDPALFHIFFDPSRLHIAISAVAAFAVVSSLFAFARFSFGYLVGFYFYTIILGYIWLNCFTDLNYDHMSAGFSAAASALGFLLPALLMSAPIRQVYVLSPSSFERLLNFILIVSAIVIIIGASYNFNLISFKDMPVSREKLLLPTALNYAIGIVSSALLPFAFAGFAVRGSYLPASVALLLLLLLYPITITKTALLLPFWLVFIVVLCRLFRASVAVILSLLTPMLVGLILATLVGVPVAQYFSVVNLRMLAIPSVAMDVYNDFFSRHPLTYFCQVSLLKQFVACPYSDQLSTVMRRAYDLGNFNASLFATEGIASVGRLFAPVSAFICGLVIGLGNRTSAGLPASFVLISSAALAHTLLNVPLTTALLTHGMILLFGLWYITPREIFKN